MDSSDRHFPKPIAQLIAGMLAKRGIRDVVISPGSRNSPLIVAFEMMARLRKHVIIDERIAAFQALGMAMVKQRPVVLICTSGTALLNYAPAIAEAYYRRLPLIVISADRPREWIDQADSQTIRQAGALANIVKRSYDLPDFPTASKEQLWYASRTLNEAYLTATGAPAGPVHINAQLNEPLNNPYPELEIPDIIENLTPELKLSAAATLNLADSLRDKRILIVAGQLHPGNRTNRLLSRLAGMPNVVVLAENLANLHSEEIISNIDSTLSELSAPEATPTTSEATPTTPDIVIVVGGALVSKRLKLWLRSLPKCMLWTVGTTDGTVVDTFKKLTGIINLEPESFFAGMLAALKQVPAESDFNGLWQEAAERGKRADKAFFHNAPWSELKAIAYIAARIPEQYNVQLSNGLSVRYSEICNIHRVHAIYCNRGVSGIDGCTSTAIGASKLYSHPTLLISGDMSFAYDIAALATPDIPNNFKAIVLNNHGGGIFRFIGATSQLPRREDYLCVPPNLPLQQLADTYGFKYFKADSAEQLKSALPEFFASCAAPSILEIVVDPEQSAEVIKQYYSH